MAEDSSNTLDDFFRGFSYLGKPTSIQLAGQEPASPGGLQAAGAPVSPSGMGGPSGSATIGSMSGGVSPGLSPALQNLIRGLGLGEKGLAALGGLDAGVPGGATQTPSGQLTFGAPEALRGLQFPEGTGFGEMPGPSIPSGTEAFGGGANLTSFLGPALSAANLIASLARGQSNPVSDISGLVNLGYGLGNVFDVLPATSAVEAALGTATEAGVAGAGLGSTLGILAPFAAILGLGLGLEGNFGKPAGYSKAVSEKRTAEQHISDITGNALGQLSSALASGMDPSGLAPKAIPFLNQLGNPDNILNKEFFAKIDADIINPAVGGQAGPQTAQQLLGLYNAFGGQMDPVSRANLAMSLNARLGMLGMPQVPLPPLTQEQAQQLNWQFQQTYMPGLSSGDLTVAPNLLGTGGDTSGATAPAAAGPVAGLPTSGGGGALQFPTPLPGGGTVFDFGAP